MPDNSALQRKSRTKAGLIAAKVCNEHRNSDLRADNPAMLAAYDAEFDALQRELEEAREECARLNGLRAVEVELSMQRSHTLRDIAQALGLDAAAGPDAVCEAVREAIAARNRYRTALHNPAKRMVQSSAIPAPGGSE